MQVIGGVEEHLGLHCIVRAAQHIKRAMGVAKQRLLFEDSINVGLEFLGLVLLLVRAILSLEFDRG